MAEVARKRVELMQGVILAPPGVTMRRATREDFDAVKQLADDTKALKGVDFLVANYHVYIRDPDRYIHVALENNKVIACFMNYVVDGGRTADGGAARRHPKYKGQIVFQALRQYSLIDTLIERPIVQKVRGGSPHVTFYNDAMLKQLHMRAISRKQFILMAQAVPCKDVAKGLTPGLLDDLAQVNVDISSVKPATKEDLLVLFKNRNLTERLFPGNCITAGLDFFEPCAQNINDVFSLGRTYTISKDSLSFCTAEFWQSPVGFVSYLILHGEASAEMAMAHFMGHVENVVKNCPVQKPLTIMYMIVDTIPREKFVTLCKMLPFHTDDKAMYEGYIVVEGIIPQVGESQL